MIHGDDPSNSNGPRKEGAEGEAHSDKNNLVKIEHVSLQELSPPPRGSIGTRLRKLFDAPTPEALSQLGEILWSCEQNSALSYFGYRLAAMLSPETAGLACEAIRRKSIACTGDLLIGLAQREYCRLMLGEPPLLEGQEFAPLRRLLADLAVSPDCHFLRKDWNEKADEIETLATYPITLLRRCADSAVDEILCNAATRGGIEPLMNRRALEILMLREASDPVKRVLPADAVNELARAAESLLREPFNSSQLYALINIWASKTENLPSLGECSIRDRILQEWKEFQDFNWDVGAEENPAIIEGLRLLRFFPDPVSSLVLKEAAEHPHAGIRIIAKLCLEGATERPFADLRKCLRRDAHPLDTMAALRVFGYQIWPSVDRLLAPVLDEYVQHAWPPENHNPDTNPFILPQKVILLQGMVRRFYTERIDSPFLKPIFDSVGSKNVALANVAINTYVQAMKLDRIPPPHFYDNPHALVSLRNTLEILGRAAKDSASEDSRSLFKEVEELFVMRGPAAYGFELVAE